MLGEIVVEHHCVTTVVAEELSHGAGRVRRKVKHGRGLGGGGSDHDGVVHGAVIFQNLDHLGDGRTLLANGAIDTDQVVALVVDDRIQNHGGFARLPVANDEFTLAAANGN